MKSACSERIKDAPPAMAKSIAGGASQTTGDGSKGPSFDEYPKVPFLPGPQQDLSSLIEVG